MGPPRRNLQATARETSSPPSVVSEGQYIARVTRAAGNNLYAVELPAGIEILVELPSRFRSTIWIKRGGYVLVDTKAFDDRENKLGGEVLNVVRDEKEWRKEAYWPKEFVKKSSYPEDSDEDESTVGKMPPNDESDADS
ncbi:MAG: hypothetical protein M1827_002421 [Pycnora praestabilis]|nr:MAG: hypothetical protein M1827_002421 [Pycnora praestabilis]